VSYLELKVGLESKNLPLSEFNFIAKYVLDEVNTRCILRVVSGY
jgi:hypothetical protein